MGPPSPASLLKVAARTKQKERRASCQEPCPAPGCIAGSSSALAAGKLARHVQISGKQQQAPQPEAPPQQQSGEDKPRRLGTSVIIRLARRLRLHCERQ